MPERIGTQLLSLSTRTTSPNYLDDVAQLAEYAERDDRHLYAYLDGIPESGVTEFDSAAALDRTDCEVRGFALTGIYNLEEYESVVNVSVGHILRETPIEVEDFPLSQFKVVAVDSDHQGRGIGTALSSTAMADLFASPPVTAMLWQRDNPANVKLAEHYSDNRLATFENYFSEDWLCPDCGFDERCACSVVMYGWFADGRPVEPAPDPDPTAAPAAEEAQVANE